MNESGTVPIDRVSGVFDGAGAPGRLARLCLSLLKEQKEAWAACRAGYASLGQAREREVRCAGFSARVQHNPGRTGSTLADVGEEGVRGRPCFLCVRNLPEGQKAVLYRDEYLVLCNPMPVFPAHFTVSCVTHERQSIAGRAGALLRLAGDFGPHFRLLYNGPRCGASAPDHMHFQAAPAGLMPVEGEVSTGDRVSIRKAGGVSVSLARNIGREVVILAGADPAAVAEAFGSLAHALAGVLRTGEEPMMNIICFRERRRYMMLVFPRAKHRPEAFYVTGDDRISVSPAVVEMGGIIVTPRIMDFERMDAACVEGIFREVSLDGETVEQAARSMG
jgi:hypothetical protein